MTHVYSELDLRKLKGQALKDAWHSMIGKPAGLKNTTGLKTSEEIIQAILRKQAEGGKCQLEEIASPPIEMPPKAKEKEKKKEVKAKHLLAIESTEASLEVADVVRICVTKKTIEGVDYYVENQTNKVYSIKDGQLQGIWNPETNSLQGC